MRTVCVPISAAHLVGLGKIQKEKKLQFRNAEHALRWAFEVSSKPIVKISSINKMRGSDQTSCEEVTTHDQHAQAALIIGLCERVLNPVQMAYVRIQFGRENSGMELMERHLAAYFGTGMYNRRAIQAIILAYCNSGKMGIRDIKKILSCGMLKAAVFRNRGYDFLDSVHSQAIDTISLEMELRKFRVAGYAPNAT